MLSKEQRDDKSFQNLLEHFGKKRSIKGFKYFGSPWSIFIGSPENACAISISVINGWGRRGWITTDTQYHEFSPHGVSAVYIYKLTDVAKLKLKKSKLAS